MSTSLSSWLEVLEGRHFKTIDLGLERCSVVWRALGEPRPGARIITVAGTNGKGSVVAYLAAILGSAGHHCGTYTSPHILRFNERVQLRGTAVSDAALIAAFEQVEAVRGEVSLTYFEFTTLAAFVLMQEHGLDWAILEVGLGGRLDAVNLVDPDCAVITPIGLDHQEYLGPDRATIAAEKAGIMRAGVPVVCGDRDPPPVIESMAASLAAPLYRIGVDFDRVQIAGKTHLQAPHGLWPFPDPPLSGPHQRDNLATALAAVDVSAPGVLENTRAWTQALNKVRVPGRLSGDARDERLILDVGHNPLAAEVVAEALAERGDTPVHCVLGMLRDKDVGGVARALAGQVGHWYLAGLDGERGQTGAQLQDRLRAALPGADAAHFPAVSAALAAARRTARAGDRILVFGSFATVAAAMRSLSGEGPGPAH
jgi:dihydrofolate synthase/folylpolyglutamate synthase